MGSLSRLGRCELAGEPRQARDGRALTVAPEVRTSIHDDGLVLLHIPSGRVFLCNSTGSQVWQGVSNGLNSEAISEQISREYGVAPDLVLQHTSAFISELER